MGGGFATAGLVPADFFPGHGAVAGLVKTLAREWPGSVRVRVVDLDPRLDVELLAADLVQEVLARDGCAEVGYLDRRRMVLRTVEAALPDSEGLGVELAQGEPVLITGGARGITAAVAADLARRWRPTLLLVGTSPSPSEHEDPATRGVTAPAELKAILHQLLARGGAGRPRRTGAGLPGVAPPARDPREPRHLPRGGGDRRVRPGRRPRRRRDAPGPRRLAARFGPIAGLIHGAGVIQDKLLRDKTPESFDRVLGTKVEGALTLARLVEPESLRFAAFFSSVAGRFGNRGQADYAAANEALNKLAIWLDRRWPGRVVSMIWGPWSGVGMVSDLEGHLGRRGLGMIAPEDGASRLADELSRGTGGDVEVIVAGDLGSLEDRPNRSSRDARCAPCPGRRNGTASLSHSAGGAGPMSAGRPLDIAIVGLACRFPGARDAAAFWENLVAAAIARATSPPIAGTRPSSSTPTRRPTTASTAGAAATSTRRSRSIPRRTGSCPGPSRGASPSSSWSSTRPGPRWPTPGWPTASPTAVASRS